VNNRRYEKHSTYTVKINHIIAKKDEDSKFSKKYIQLSRQKKLKHRRSLTTFPSLEKAKIDKYAVLALPLLGNYLQASMDQSICV